jgi:hypothetical protein
VTENHVIESGRANSLETRWQFDCKPAQPAIKVTAVAISPYQPSIHHPRDEKKVISLQISHFSKRP